MKGKTALITGSGAGLGKRTAVELAKQGIHIVMSYVASREQTIRFAALLEQTYNIKAMALPGDVTRNADLSALANAVFKEFGAVDILVNNAGPYVRERKRMVDYELDEWNRIVNGNLNSVFYLCKLLVPKMRERQWGRIVNIGFDRAESAAGWKYRSAFAAAKVGLVSLTKTLAMEEASYGITANMVCPGDIVEPWKEADIGDVRGMPDAATPVGRAGTGEDIARVIAFLCQDDSDFITGSVISVTGGKDVLGKNK